MIALGNGITQNAVAHLIPNSRHENPKMMVKYCNTWPDAMETAEGSEEIENGLIRFLIKIGAVAE